MRIAILLIVVAAILCAGAGKKDDKKPKAPKESPLDVYVNQANERAKAFSQHDISPGSLWTPVSGLTDLARDLRASQIDDIVTIVVSENASAVATGQTKTARTSAAKSSVTALGSQLKATSALTNLLNLSGQSSLDGSGTTSRTTTLNTTVSARVIRVLPNGYLVVEGTKGIGVDSERQLITVTGVVRPSDITTGNTVPSTRLAEMEVKVNGKGVVADSTRRPNFLYRLLLGILPF